MTTTVDELGRQVYQLVNSRNKKKLEDRKSQIATKSAENWTQQEREVYGLLELWETNFSNTERESA